MHVLKPESFRLQELTVTGFSKQLAYYFCHHVKIEKIVIFPFRYHLQNTESSVSGLEVSGSDFLKGASSTSLAPLLITKLARSLQVIRSGC